MHEITISTSDKPKLFSQVLNLISWYNHFSLIKNSVFTIFFLHIMVMFVIITRHHSNL